MATAKRDENRVTSLLGVSSVDSATTTVIEADPTTKGLNVQIVGDDVGIGGGTQYTEDVATANPQVGNAIMVERDNQLAAVTPAEGDWIGLRGTEKGALWVALADASGDPITAFGGGTEYTEDVATANPQVGKAIMMERDDALSAVTPAEGDWIGLRGTAEGALWTQDFNSDASLALLGTIDADTGAIKTAVELLDNAVDGNYLNANLNIAGTDVSANAGVLTDQTLRVTIATDDECNNYLGTIDADTSNMATYTAGAEAALEKIDGAIVGPGEPTIDSYTHLAINLNAAANQVLVSSAASKQIWVYGITYTCSVAGTVSFQDEDDTAITGIMDHAANSGLSHPTNGNFAMPIWKLGTDKDLEVDVVDAAIDGWLDYAIVSV